MINNELKAKKEETSLKIFDLSPEVSSLIRNMTHLVDDLKLIIDITEE